VTTSDAPNMTLDEVLEDLLPRFKDDPFAVAKLVDDNIKKKEGLVLLADGTPVSPELYSGHLRIEARLAHNGKPSLRVLVLRSFGHAERAEAIVGWREVKNELGEPIKDGRGGTIKEPIKEPFDMLIGPIKEWAIERKSFEVNRPGAPRNLGGRDREVDRERLLREALIYSVVYGWPDKLDGDGGLYDKLAARVKNLPSRTTLYDIFRPVAVCIEDERARSAKKP
jgi:hypothetical protein